MKNTHAEMDRAYHLHPFTSLRAHASGNPTVIVEGKGCRLWDCSGREYLDAMAGLWCVNVGYGRREIADAMREQAVKLAYYHAFASMTSDAPAELAARIVTMAPSSFCRVFFGNSGSDANDTAVKLVWYYNNTIGRPLKKKILARNRAYHGVTVAAGSLTGLDGVHESFDLPLIEVPRLTTPHHYWVAETGISEEEFSEQLAQQLESVIEQEGAETIGAMIAEPVMGAGGVFVPPRSYFELIQPILKANDILLIADEVISGFGRLGADFGSNLFQIEPDIMTIAKGLTSGYQPLSGCVVTESVYEVIEQGSERVGFFGHGYTYSAHPIAAATAMINLDIIKREELVKASAERGEYLNRQLIAKVLPHPLVGNVRSKGLIAGVELVANKTPRESFDPQLGVAKRVYQSALDKGLITRALQSSEILAISPPLIISTTEIDELISKLIAALDEVHDELDSSSSSNAKSRVA